MSGRLVMAGVLLAAGVFFTRPLTVAILALALVAVLLPYLPKLARRGRITLAEED